jgi:hypothetical protein
MSILSKTSKEIETHIQEGMKLRQKEKDEFGEVFTSTELIDELFDNLPLSSWTNPELKWLDPCAGRGNFFVIAYYRLMRGLGKKFPDNATRSKHIVKNMFYMIELNPDNVQELQKLFGKDANISECDFLDNDEKWKMDLGQTQFDFIVGNPPFQSSKHDKYAGSVGNRTLWDKFLAMIFSNSLLNAKGFVAFINPSNWRRPEHDLYSIITRDNTLLYLHIYGKKDGFDKFGAQTRFDLYIVQEGAPDKTHKTQIIDEKGHSQLLNLHSWPFLPNYAYSKIKPLLVSKENGIPVIFSAGDYDARKLSKTRSKNHRIPVVHNITRKGLGIRFAKDKLETQLGVPKILLNFNERQYPYNDYRGEYGMSQLTFGIPIKSKKEGEEWISAIESPAFEEIIRATKWGAFQTDYRMFKYFDPKIYQKSTFRKTKRQH